jgi:hypothetical protein
MNEIKNAIHDFILTDYLPVTAVRGGGEPLTVSQENNHVATRHQGHAR